MEDLSMKKYGFTLIELLIVIGIIGILISISVASYSTVQKKSRDSRRFQDLKAVQSAMEQYYADHSSAYPTLCTDLTATGAYLPGGLPTDPKNSGTYVYHYYCQSTSYCMCALLEAGMGGNAGTDPGGPTCSYSSGSYFCVGNLQ
jgi:prepilin-type N-terminal cleavage/methylation domain-containing protein